MQTHWSNEGRQDDTSILKEKIVPGELTLSKAEHWLNARQARVFRLVSFFFHVANKYKKSSQQLTFPPDVFRLALAIDSLGLDSFHRASRVSE